MPPRICKGWTTWQWIRLGLLLVLGSFFAVTVVLNAIGWVVGHSTQDGPVRVTNDTTQTWSFCGIDCAHHETVLLPGDALGLGSGFLVDDLGHPVADLVVAGDGNVTICVQGILEPGLRDG